MFPRCLLAVPILFLLAGPAPGADLKLAPVLGDRMVLQRDEKVAIWGVCSPGQEVKVTFSGKSHSEKADSSGRWLVRLDPMPANDRGSDLVVAAGTETLTLRDVLVGDVWLLGGQSNMEMPLWLRGDGKENAKDTRLVLDADHPWLRIMTVTQAATRKPQEDFGPSQRDGDGVPTLQWFASKSRDPAISGFSALGYFIAQRLHEKTGVPIGMIDTSWGGTIASAWNDRKVLDGIPEAREFLMKKDAAADAWTEDGAKQKLAEELAAWEKRAAIAKRDKKNPPHKPSLMTDPAQDRNFPSGPFNAMIWPLRHMTLRGVFFYQGENNFFDRVDPFAQTFPGVVVSWRKAFGDDQLPFCIIQICGWENADRVYWQTKLPIIQEQQHRAHLSLPGTGFVVTGDHPHVDIHPMRKRPIAERAARWARAEVHGEKGLTWGSAVLESSRKDGQRILLRFKVPGGEKLRLTGKPSGFALCGPDRKFIEANAEMIDDNTIAVWSEKVTEPTSVRYAWSQRGAFRLYTETGLPVGPFRTDDWVIPASEIRD